MNDEYKIGDKVVVIDASGISYAVGVCSGLIGTICTDAINADDDIMYGVEFDNKLKRGNSCHGKCRGGHGYFMYPREIAPMELISDESIELNSEFDNILGSILRTK